jgi:hypothetical protein
MSDKPLKTTAPANGLGMTVAEFTTRLDALIAEAYKAGLPSEDVATILAVAAKREDLK